MAKREKRDRQNNTESSRETIKTTEKQQDGEGRVVFHAGLVSRPTLKLLHLFTVQFSSELQPQSTTWSPFKVNVTDCAGSAEATLLGASIAFYPLGYEVKQT